MGKLVEELIKGRDLTKQLRTMIPNPNGDDAVVAKQKELADKIFGSFTEAIFLIGSGSCEYSDDVFQSPGSPGDRSLVNSGQSCKRPGVKDGRGGYKRRKSSESWTKVSSTMVDEYAWRKYGQKEILNATFPRCYFRCTHKHDQGCKATKQVQIIQDQPINYQITYFGNHTCKKTLQLNLENINLDSYSQESNLINFQSNTSSSCPSSFNEEKMELEVQSDLNWDKFSPLGSINWSDLTTLVRSDVDEEFLPGVYSYASSMDSHGSDMDFFSKCDDLGNCFPSTF